jgi:cell division septal protein FtsQ
MSCPKTKSAKKRMLPYIYFFMVVIVFSMLSVVVIMLLTGSLQLINDRYVHLEHINIVTITIAAAVVATAILFFLKKSKIIFRFIEEQVTQRT